MANVRSVSPTSGVGAGAESRWAFEHIDTPSAAGAAAGETELDVMWKGFTPAEEVTCFQGDEGPRENRGAAPGGELTSAGGSLSGASLPAGGPVPRVLRCLRGRRCVVRGVAAAGGAAGRGVRHRIPADVRCAMERFEGLAGAALVSGPVSMLHGTGVRVVLDCVLRMKAVLGGGMSDVPRRRDRAELEHVAPGFMHGIRRVESAPAQALHDTAAASGRAVARSV